MSAPKHTPGPWWSAEYPFDSGDHSTLVVVRDAVGRETWLARCEHNWGDADCFERRISWAEAEANARLIAAAPDLLAAVESAPIPAPGEEMMAFRDRVERWKREVKAPAIAKATGAT